MHVGCVSAASGDSISWKREYIMDAYERYIFEMNKGDFTATPAAAVTATEGEYGIDKTYAQLKAMFDKGNLHGLKWHLEDGTIVMVPLTSAEADAFVFSLTIGADVHVFTMTTENELVYGTVAVCAGGDSKPDSSTVSYHE